MPRRIEAGFNKGYSFLRRAIRLLRGYPIVSDVNHSAGKVRRRRALLVYLTEPFLLKETDPIFYWHQNFRQSRQIAAMLDEFGYQVDVADIRTRRFPASAAYNLLISHNGQLGESSRLLCPRGQRIYLSTGMGHRIHNYNIRRRYAELAGRRGRLLQVRQLNEEQMPFLVEANAIVGFGNELTRATWREEFSGPIWSFPNYAFRETEYIHRETDFNEINRNFLFFASWSQVGKGLDLLLEVFAKHPNLHLYICSAFKKEADFCRCYRQELFATPNIHPVGMVRAHSEEFYRIVRQCTFVILPTAAESQVGSVLQCMAAGLIPLVSKEAGIDVEDFGIDLKGCRIAEIDAAVNQATASHVGELRERSAKARLACETIYSEDAFKKKWLEILAAIQEQLFKGD
jgi:hypothetical protein